MLEEYTELNRKPTVKEEKLIEFLLKNSIRTIYPNWKENILVRPMNDGYMGSLRLIINGEDNEDRIFGEQLSEYHFKDKDGIDVIASLNLDDKGNLFELDIWKTDFSPLIELPDL